MKEKYAILRHGKLKTGGQIASAEGHNNRTRPVENCNPDLTPLNESLIPRPENLYAAIRERIGDNGGKKVYKNAVLAIEVFMTASPEYFRDDPAAHGVYDQKKMEQWRDKALEFLKESWGDRIVSAELHLDEATPHIHAVCVPIDEKNHLNAREVTSRKNLQDFQTDYARPLAVLGLKRGRQGSGAKHISIKEFYGQLNSTKRTRIPATPKLPKPPQGGVFGVTRKQHSDYAQRLHKTSIKRGKRGQIALRELRKIEPKAQMFDLMKAENEQLKTVNSRLSVENKKLRAIANQVRPIPMKTVLEDYRDAYPDNDTDISKAKNAIDLVKALDDCDYKTAVKTLADNYTPEAAKAEVAAEAAKAAVDGVDSDIELRGMNGSRPTWAQIVKDNKAKIKSKSSLNKIKNNLFFEPIQRRAGHPAMNLLADLEAQYIAAAQDRDLQRQIQRQVEALHRAYTLILQQQGPVVTEVDLYRIMMKELLADAEGYGLEIPQADLDAILNDAMRAGGVSVEKVKKALKSSPVDPETDKKETQPDQQTKRKQNLELTASDQKKIEIGAKIKIAQKALEDPKQAAAAGAAIVELSSDLRQITTATTTAPADAKSEGTKTESAPAPAPPKMGM